MAYKLDLNLQQRAILKIAISFWESQEVKDRAAEFFRSHENSLNFKADKKWGELTKSVVDDWNKDILPQKLEDELIHIVKMIGETIFGWFQCIKDEYFKDEKAIYCLDTIKWTPYGTVDEIQTFKSFLLTNPNLDITKVYSFACRHAISDHINDLWDKIPDYLQTGYYKDAIYYSFDNHIVAYWKCCKDNDLHNFMRYCQKAKEYIDGKDIIMLYGVLDGKDVFNLLYDLDHSVNENMLRLTVYHGHFVAMKYFWERLTEEERDQSVLKCARIAVLRWSHAERCSSTLGYKLRQYVEICVFLLNHLKNKDKKLFYNGNVELELGVPVLEEFDVKNEILTMLLCKWPWEELFVPVLEDMLHYVDDESKMDCQFLDTITCRMYKDFIFRYSLETKKYRLLLREVWLIIPAHLKRKIPQVNRNCEFINDLIDVGDLDSLNLIINDPEIAAVRDQFIDFGCTSYEELVVNNQFEKLDYLIEEIFKFEEEQKKSFKQKINPWSDIFKDNNFDLADKFLDWQSCTPEERQTRKNNIDHMTLCMEFINDCEYEILDKFLDWKFETIEERISCEEHFKNDIFVIKRVYHIWRNNLGGMQETSSRFLDWVFKSSEKIKYFKKETLVNFENHQFIIGKLSSLRRCLIINEFFSWCSLDDTKIKRIFQVI